MLEDRPTRIISAFITGHDLWAPVTERRDCAPALEQEFDLMPRYYFHIKDGVDLPDDEGSEFPDLDSARSEAVRLSGEVLQEGHASSLWQGEPWQLQVTDGPIGAGRLLFTLNFSAVEAA